MARESWHRKKKERGKPLRTQRFGTKFRSVLKTNYVYTSIYVSTYIPGNVINKRYDLAILFLTSFIPHKKCGTPQIEEPS